MTIPLTITITTLPAAQAGMSASPSFRTRPTAYINTIQYNTIQYNTIQYNTIQYNTIQYNTYIHTYIYTHAPEGDRAGLLALCRSSPTI